MSNINKIIKKELKEFKNDIGSSLLILLMAVVMIAGMMVFFAYDFSKSNREIIYTAYIEESNEGLAQIIDISGSFKILDDKEKADIIISGSNKDVDIKYNSNEVFSIKAVENLNQIIEAYNNQILIAELDQNNISKPDTYITTSLIDTKPIDQDPMSVGDAIVKILLPMAILFFVPLVIMTPASSIITSEKDSKSVESTLLLPISRKEIVIGKFFTIAIIGIVSLLVIIATFILTTIAIKSLFDVDVSLGSIDYIEIFLAGLSYLLPVGAAGIILSLIAKNVKSAQILGTVAFFIFAGLTQVPNLIKENANLKFAPLINNGMVLNQIANFDQTLDLATLFMAIAMNIVITVIFIALANKMIKNENYIIAR